MLTIEPIRFFSPTLGLAAAATMTTRAARLVVETVRAGLASLAATLGPTALIDLEADPMSPAERAEYEAEGWDVQNTAGIKEAEKFNAAVDTLIAAAEPTTGVTLAQARLQGFYPQMYSGIEMSVVVAESTALLAYWDKLQGAATPWKTILAVLGIAGVVGGGSYVLYRQTRGGGGARRRRRR